MNLKKTLLLAVALLICVCTVLTSCDGLLGGDTGGGENPPANGDSGTGGNDQNDDNTLTYRVVYADSSIDYSDILTALRQLCGPAVTAVDDETEPLGYEVALGDTSRDITAKAKAALEAHFFETAYDSGYIIFAEGNNVAVYWSADRFKEDAISAFISVCVEDMEMKLSDGTVEYELYNASELSASEQWADIEEQYGTDMANALKQLHAYYQGPKIAGWIANLYDPEVGGFYYSRSARDYEGFLPDLESTSQSLSILANLGAIPSSKIGEMLPEDVRIKIVEFVRNMQSPEDGYFYHPQWAYGKENLNTDRYGRDQGSATSILSRVMVDSDGNGTLDTSYPNYCTVDGTKCALHNGKKEACSFPVSVSYVADRVGGSVSTLLTSDVSFAVSRVNNSVVKATASSHPDYSSEAAFLAWLRDYNKDIKVNSGGAHNLAALIDEIMARGYADTLIDYLDEMQAELFEEQVANGETPTGIWQRPIDYKAVWGCYKYMYIYNTVGRPINPEYAPYMIETCLAVVALPADGKYAYNDLMNQWSAITSVISNVNKFQGYKAANELYEIVRRDPVELVRNSLEKMRPFRQEDGSFSNNVNGTTSSSIYGVSIALGGIAEGNVNSTHILLNMYFSICTALGVPKVALCTLEDGWEVAETMASSEPIEKNFIEKEMYDFEDGNLPSYIKNDHQNASSVLEVTEDPEGVSSGSLYFYSPVGASSGDTMFMTLSGMGGNCFVFDTDMYVDDESSNGTIFQIRLENSYMLEIANTNGTLKIREASSINGDKRVDLATVSTDEWFNLRIEYYVSGEDTNGLELPVIRVWINEEHVIDSGNFFGSHNEGASPNNSCTSVRILSLRAVETHLYLDNTYAARESLTLDVDDTDYPGKY